MSAFEEHRSRLTVVEGSAAHQIAQQANRCYLTMDTDDFLENIDEIAETDINSLMVRGLIYASGLKDRGVKTLRDNLLKGEDEAIESFLRTPLKGNHANLVLASVYGSGKTELIEHGFKVFGGLDEIAKIPGRPDLRARDLTGLNEAIKKTTE